MVFLLLSIQSIRPTYFGKTINDWFQFILITLLSQSGNNTVLLMQFVIMTGFFYPDNLIFLSGLI